MDAYSFQSITLTTLQCARQDRKIEVSCSRGNREMKMEVEVVGGEGRRAVRTQHPKELRCGPAPTPTWTHSMLGEKRREEGIRREEEKEETGDVDEWLPERDMQIKKA